MTSQNSFRIEVDQHRLVEVIKKYLLLGLDKAVDRLTSVMEKEIGYNITHGRSDWRRSLAKSIGEVYRTVKNDVYEVGVGVNPDKFDYHIIVAGMLTHGSGFWGGGYPIHAGPRGRQVWGDDLGKGAGQHSSKSPSTYDLPTRWNIPGYNWIDSAYDIVKNEFRGIIMDAWRSIPEREIIACFSIVTRR